MSDSKMTPLEIEVFHQRSDLGVAWRDLLSTEAGRWVLWSILDKAGIAKPGAAMFVHFGTDSDLILRGRQQVGGEILDEFVHGEVPEAFYDMMKEADDRESRLRMAEKQTETEDEQED